MTTVRTIVRRSVPLVFSAARIGIGILWLLEGTTKYRAGFGGDDIGFIVTNAAQGGRIPGYFSWFAASVMAPLEPLFGFAIPLLETTLGVLLVLGVLTLPAALASLGTLLLYWSSDQLITQYPIMAALSAVVIVAPKAARAYSAVSFARRRSPGDAPWWL